MITFGEPPADGLAVVIEEVQARIAYPADLRVKYGFQSAQAIEIAQPHQIWTVDLEGASKGRLLEGAVGATWRYPLFQVGLAAGAIEIEPAQGTHGSRFVAWEISPRIKSFATKLSAAQELARSRNYECRLLRIEGIYLEALWLYGGEGSLLFPLAPFPSVFEDRLEGYEMQELTNVVRGLAAPRLEAVRRRQAV